MKLLYSFLLIFHLIVPGSSRSDPQSAETKDSYVGKAGDVFISRDEFLRRFEMLPGFNRQNRNTLEESKLEFLYSLIAEKLLAQEARTRGLDKDSVFVKSFNEIVKMLSRDELYREEVSRKITVSSGEIDRAVRESLRCLLVSFIFAGKEEDALMIRKQIHSVRDFDRLEIDSSIDVVRDTVTVTWGEAETGIEDAVYKLKPGEVSPVIPAGEGFYILKLVSEQPNPYYTGMQPSVLHERVTDRLRERKERVRTMEYVGKLLKDKEGYSRPLPFRLLVNALSDVARHHGTDTLIRFDAAMYEEVREKCAPSLLDTFAVAGKTWWTMEDVVSRLRAESFSVKLLNLRKLPSILNSVVRDWVQQELIAQEALARHLDRTPGVNRELEVWQQQFLSEMMKAYIRSHVNITDGDVWNAIRSTDNNLSIPRVRIRELKTTNVDDMKSGLEELQGGASFEDVAARWSDNEELRRNKGVLEYFPITEHPPVGELAWELSIGERYGPVSVGHEYVYFELLDKDQTSLSKDSAAAGLRDSIKAELFRMKVKRTTDLLLAQAGERRGFSIYQESLMNIEVSQIPMMTYRLLGFGGRMFAAPFVSKQLDWLNVEPPTSVVVP